MNAIVDRKFTKLAHTEKEKKPFLTQVIETDIVADVQIARLVLMSGMESGREVQTLSLILPREYLDITSGDSTDYLPRESTDITTLPITQNENLAYDSFAISQVFVLTRRIIYYLQM
jgi:hypothetical protein